MARNLTWCLKHTVVLTNRLNLHLRSTPILRASNYVTKKFVVEKPVVKHTDINDFEPRDLVKFEEDAQATVKQASSIVAKILKITYWKATDILQDYPQVKRATQKTLYKNFDNLHRSGLTNNQLRENLHLLAEPVDELEEKISIIQSMGLDVNVAVQLFHLTLRKLKMFQINMENDKSCIPNSNRLLYLAEKLNKDMETMCHLIIYNDRLTRLPMEKIKNDTEFMLEIGITPEYISHDLLVYLVKSDMIKAQLQRAKALGVYPLKPWLVRCTEEQWKIFEQRLVDQGGEVFDIAISKEEYFSQIFNCSLAVAKYVMNKDKRLLRMNRNKFITNAKIVKARGYSLIELMSAKVILCFCTKTLRNRFAQWDALGLPQKPVLRMFAQYRGDYEKWYNEASKEANKIKSKT